MRYPYKIFADPSNFVGIIYRYIIVILVVQTDLNCAQLLLRPPDVVYVETAGEAPSIVLTLVLPHFQGELVLNVNDEATGFIEGHYIMPFGLR